MRFMDIDFLLFLYIIPTKIIVEMKMKKKIIYYF